LIQWRTYTAPDRRGTTGDQENAMKLRLRIGRQRDQTGGTEEVRGDSDVAEQAPATASAHVPLPRIPDRDVVRAGTFCRASEVGRTAVTETGRAVLAIRAGRCGRWVYDDRPDRAKVRPPGSA
jgi:hypothetical protein